MKAEEYFKRIDAGHQNAIQRPPSPYVDRVLREMVERANRTGDCIINVGNGYYRPLPGNEIDEAELNGYLASELSRARKILSKRLAMMKTFKEWKDNDLFAYHTWKAE